MSVEERSKIVKRKEAGGRKREGRRREKAQGSGLRGFHLRKLRRNLPVVRKSVLIKAVSSKISLSRPSRPSGLGF